MRYVDVPYETHHEHRVEEIHENVIVHENVQEVDFRDLHRYHGHRHMEKEVRLSHKTVEVDVPVYHDNIIEKVVDRHYDKIIEVPKERIVEKYYDHVVERPVYYDNIIEKIVEVPVERIIENHIENLVHVPVYRDNIITKSMPVEVIREEIEEVRVDEIIEQPVYHDNIIEHIIENPVRMEVVTERERIVDVPQYVDRRVHLNNVEGRRTQINIERPKVVTRTENVPIECEIWRHRPVANNVVVDVHVPTFNTRATESIIRKDVRCEVVVEKPVPVRKNVEVLVENVIERPIYIEEVEHREVKYDQVIDEEYEVLVQKVREVHVEKQIVVPRKTRVQEPVVQDHYTHHDHHVETTVVHPVEGHEINEGDVEVTDEEISHRIRQNRERANRFHEENKKLEHELASFRHSVSGGNLHKLNSIVKVNADLKAHTSELTSRLDVCT